MAGFLAGDLALCRGGDPADPTPSLRRWTSVPPA
jgi:hypothetical protein